MPQCAFRNCLNNHRNTKILEQISFFRFPSDPFRCAEWVSIVAKEREEMYKPCKNSTICSIHFDRLDITGNSQRRRLLKTAVPKLQIHGPIKVQSATFSESTNLSSQAKKSMSPQKTLQPQKNKQECEPIQEFVKDSTAEFTDELISDEAIELGDESKRGESLVREKVYLKPVKYRETQCEESQTHAKLARFETFNDHRLNFTEQLYEFAKFVAEQLMCLSIDDAHVAQMEIKGVLSKFSKNNSMCFTEPSIFNVQPTLNKHCAGTGTISQANRTMSSAVSNSELNTNEPLVTPSDSQVNVEPIQTGQSLTDAFNVNPSPLLMAPFDCDVVPAAIASGPNTTIKIVNMEGVVDTRSGSAASVGTIPSTMIEPESYRTACTGVAVKTEPETELSHEINVSEPDIATSQLTMFEFSSGRIHLLNLSETEPESLVLKFEAESDNET